MNRLEMTDHARRTKRYAAKQGLALRCDSWQDFVQFYASDISQGGLFIVTDAEMEVMSTGEVRLDLPEGHQVPLRARVVHVLDKAMAEAEGKQTGVGVEFLDMDGETKSRIRQLVDFARWEGMSGSNTFASHMFERAASHQTLTEIIQSLPPEQGTPSARTTGELGTARQTSSGQPSARPKRQRRMKRPTHGETRATGKFLKSDFEAEQTAREEQEKPPPKPSDTIKLKEAMTHFAHRRYREAIVDLKKMDEDNPGDVEANRWLHIAEARLAIGNQDEESAARHYQRALRFDEDNREARKFVREYHRSRKLSAIPFGRLFTKRNSE